MVVKFKKFRHTFIKVSEKNTNLSKLTKNKIKTWTPGFRVFQLMLAKAQKHPELPGSATVVYHEAVGHGNGMPHPEADHPRGVMGRAQYCGRGLLSADVYLERGAEMIASLNAVARSGAAFATVRSVRTRQLDDHMPSFFLAETLKYLCARPDPHTGPQPRRSNLRNS